MFYYSEYTLLECLEQEVLNAQRELKDDIDGIWSERLDDLKEEIAYWEAEENR